VIDSPFSEDFVPAEVPDLRIPIWPGVFCHSMWLLITYKTSFQWFRKHELGRTEKLRGEEIKLTGEKFRGNRRRSSASKAT
jgi:hypothetical protein